MIHSLVPWICHGHVLLTIYHVKLLDRCFFIMDTLHNVVMNIPSHFLIDISLVHLRIPLSVVFTDGFKREIPSEYAGLPVLQVITCTLH